MAARTDGAGSMDLLTGVAGGLVGAVVTGVVIQFGFNPTVLAADIPRAFGLRGLVAGWAVFLVLGGVIGLVYAGLARLEALQRYAVVPGPGAGLGLAYGLVVWVLAVILVPLLVGAGTGAVGSYAVNLQGVLSFALLGVIVGLVYGWAPYTG